MDIKLNNNALLSLGSTIDDNIVDNCTTIYVKDCPNVSGINILRQCDNLTRVRLDIGSVSGSITELLSYTYLNGFNDNYENQIKPRLVGTWTVNDYYTSSQLAEAQGAFDGLTIVSDSNYLIDYSDIAVQTLDSTQPNYNPSVGIILQGQLKGTTINNPVISGGGKWFISKTQAAAITDIGTWFSKKTTVTDTNGIVSSDTTATYNFTSFDELKYFGVTSIPSEAFACCENLVSISLDNITSILKRSFFKCTSLRITQLPPGLTTLGEQAFGKIDVLFDSIPSGVTSYSVTTRSGMPDGTSYYSNTGLLKSTPSGVLTFLGALTSLNIGYDTYLFNSALGLHLNQSTVPTLTVIGTLNANKIYVGFGNSQSDDDAILADFVADSSWSAYSNILDTWYNYLHPTT